jgi:1-acyl-sn-glycerol-3-phosphate acyltransferase
MDGFVVVSSVPVSLRKDLYLVGFEAFFDHFLIRNLIKYLKVIPIDPGTHLVEAMQASSYVLRNDKMVCIFPEGDRTTDGELLKFKKGVGILAKELNVTLVPAYIAGSYESWPRTKWFPRPHPVKITFGRPFGFEELKKEGLKLGAKDDYEAISFAIREEVKKLK